MRKLFLSAAMFAASLVGMAQVLPSDYNSADSPLDVDLNDSVNKYYSVNPTYLTKVSGVEIIDSSLFNMHKWFASPYTELYKPSFNLNNEMEVVFSRSKGKADNYEGFNLVWAGWGKRDMSPMPRTGLYPFPYKVTVTAAIPVITSLDASKIDSLYGYSVNLYDNPVVRMKVKCNQPIFVLI